MTAKSKTGLAIFAVALGTAGCGRADVDAKFASARPALASKPSRISLVEDPFLKGKVVMIGSTDNAEAVYQRSPGIAAVEARTPDEVGTVILNECRSQQKGVYRTADNPPREVPAMALDCSVSLIDRAADSVYFIQHFEGKLGSETSIAKISNSVAAAPEQEISEFLAKLPRN